MKRSSCFWLVILLAVWVVPICAMAADMNLRLMTQDGYSLTTNTPTISNFAVDNDNTLVIILKEPPILDFGDPYPEIAIETAAGCTIVNNAHVKANPGATFSFNVRTTQGATLSSTSNPTHPSIVPSNDGASFVASGNVGTFSWNTSSTPPGRYLAVFSATPGTCNLPSPSTCTSQLVVVINIALQYKLTLTAGPNGSVSPAGVTYYDPGTQVQISATANQGYYCSGWSDQGTGNPRTVTMDRNRTISAAFAQASTTYTVNATVVNSAGGSVTPASRTGIISGNTTTFTVTTNPGYTASVSEGSLSGTTWTTAPVTSNHTVTVTFTSSSGLLGSKTNPIPLNKNVGAGYYYPSNGGGTSGCQVSVSGKVYFVFNPSSSMTWTRLIIKGYANTTLKYWKQVQTKAGQDIGGEVSIYNSQGDGMDDEMTGRPYNFSTTRFLYAVEGTQIIDIYVQYF
jgi:hypothetical protein